MEAKVEAYAGVRYPERPRAFVYGGERLEIAKIERRQRTPQELRFWVQTDDGRRFRLAYDGLRDAWDVQPLDRPPGPSRQGDPSCAR